MALTRNDLKVAGLTEEQISFVIEKHTETIAGLKAERDEAKEKAKIVDDLQQRNEELKAAAEERDTLKKQYDDEHAAFEKYRGEITAKETKAAKESAAKAYFERKGIVGKNLAIAMRGAKTEIDGLAINDGKISDYKALDELIKGDFAGLVSSEQTKGADTSTPPANSSNTSFNDMTLSQKMMYANEHGRSDVVKTYLNN